MLIEPVKTEYQPCQETKTSFIIWVLIAYIAAEITGILFHPMWRDEMHPWSMAGASSSLWDLLQRKEVDGHPDLWYILVYIIRSLSDNPLSLQLMHSGIAILDVFLILKYAPFTRVQRTLLVFGYFFLFEYAMISRNYAIGVLLVTLFLVLYRQRARYLLIMAIILFFMTQCNVFSFILSLAIVLTWIYEFILSPEFRNDLLRQKTTLIFSILIVITGIAYCLHSIIPSTTAYFAGASHFSLSQLTLRETIRSVAVVWKAWVPIPVLNAGFWNTNFIGSAGIEAILSLILIFSAAFYFCKQPVVFFLFTTGLSGIIAFILMYYYGYIRHHGHLFILLFACLWLREYYRESKITLRFTALRQYHGWLKNKFSMLFFILLSVQLLAGIFAVTIQFFVPFSAARQTARYIRQHNLDRFLIAGNQDVALETVSGYLNKNTFYFSRNAFSTYLVYDDVRKTPGISAVRSKADSLMKTKGDTILLVMNIPLEELADLNLKKIQSFEKSITLDEIYYLYFLLPMKKQEPFINSQETPAIVHQNL